MWGALKVKMNKYTWRGNFKCFSGGNKIQDVESKDC